MFNFNFDVVSNFAGRQAGEFMKGYEAARASHKAAAPAPKTTMRAAGLAVEAPVAGLMVGEASVAPTEKLKEMFERHLKSANLLAEARRMEKMEGLYASIGDKKCRKEAGERAELLRNEAYRLEGYED